MRVGLTGGIGSGKSEVAAVFVSCGAFLIDADLLAREVVSPGSPGLAEIAHRWPSVLTDAGELDRSALGKIVFADAAARTALNDIVHPEVRRLGREREALAAAGQMIVHVVPLLFECGFAEQCDRNVVVIAPLDLRLKWLEKRDGLSSREIHARIAAQIDPAEARRRADAVIENRGDLFALHDAARAVYRKLVQGG